MNTQSRSVGARSSIFWVGVYPAVNPGPSAPHSTDLPALSPFTLPIAPKKQNHYSPDIGRHVGATPEMGGGLASMFGV